MILERFYPTQESRMARTPSCNFIGHLENEKTACVSLTGCASSDDLHFTINSKNSGSSNMYILHKDGHLELVESAFKVCSYMIIFQIYWWGFFRRNLVFVSSLNFGIDHCLFQKANSQFFSSLSEFCVLICQQGDKPKISYKNIILRTHI